MTSSENPTLADGVSGAIWSTLANVHTVMPGIVQAYDAATQQAEVKPQLKKNYLDGTELSLPVISSVPVIFPRTATASLTFPVAKGDKVLLVFSERSLDEYLSLGKEVKPQDRRKFDLSDAIAIPGLYDFSTPSPSNGEDVELQHKTQKITIKANGDIEVGAESLKKLVNEEFKALFNSHVHKYLGFVGTGTPTPGATSAPVSITGTGPLGAFTQPLLPPFVTGYLEKGMTDTHLTNKVKGQ